MRLSAERNIIGLGLPTTYGSLPVAFVMSAAIAPVAGSDAVAERAGGVGVRRDEARAGADEPDRLGDRLERVVAGLADDDVVGIGLGHDEAGLVQRGGEPRLADHEGRAAGHLDSQEVGRRERRRPDRAPRARSRPDARSRALRSRGVKIELFVSTRNGRALVAPLLQQLGRAGDRACSRGRARRPCRSASIRCRRGSACGSAYRRARGVAGRRVGVVARADRSWDPRAPSRPDRSRLPRHGVERGPGLLLASSSSSRAGARVIMTGRNPNRPRRGACRACDGGFRMPRPSASRRSCSTRATSGRCGRPRRARGCAGALDGLLLNAGIVHPPKDRETTGDGNEVVFATNVLGHFALAGRAAVDAGGGITAAWCGSAACRPRSRPTTRSTRS